MRTTRDVGATSRSSRSSTITRLTLRAGSHRSDQAYRAANVSGVSARRPAPRRLTGTISYLARESHTRWLIRVLATLVLIVLVITAAIVVIVVIIFFLFPPPIE